MTEFTEYQVRLMDEHAELAAVVKKKGYGVWAMPIGDNDFDAMTEKEEELNEADVYWSASWQEWTLAELDENGVEIIPF